MLSEGLPRTARLRNTREFELVYRQGWKAHTRHFVLQGLPQPGDKLRLGLTVSRKVGPAHERNLVKRRVREFVRRHRPEIARALAPDAGAGEGLDLVVIAKRGAAKLGREEAERELWGGLQRRREAGRHSK
jgi:ribonuclease P protein component